MKYNKLLIMFLLILFFRYEEIALSKFIDENYKGFIFGTSEYISYEKTSIFIHIEDYKWEEDEVSVTLDINIFCRNKTKNDYIYYLLQTPYSMIDVDIQYLAKYPEFYSGNTVVKYLDEQDISYLLIRIPKINASLGKILYIKINFK